MRWTGYRRVGTHDGPTSHDGPKGHTVAGEDDAKDDLRRGEMAAKNECQPHRTPSVSPARSRSGAASPVLDAEKAAEARKVVAWRDLPRKQQLVVITMARLSEPLVQTSLQVCSSDTRLFKTRGCNRRSAMALTLSSRTCSTS